MSMPQSGPQGQAGPGQPGIGEAATADQAQAEAAPQAGQAAGQWRPEWGPGPQGGQADPTAVVGPRVGQYIIDAILAAIVPGLLLIATAPLHGGLHTIGSLVWLVLAIVAYVWYWVLRPAGHGGQTFGMQMLGLAVVSKAGGPASKGQLAGRWLLLIVDGLFGGLVGLITMLASSQHQRVGDIAAGTLVVRAGRASAR